MKQLSAVQENFNHDQELPPQCGLDMNNTPPVSRRIRVGCRIRLEAYQSWEESFHVFDEESALAVEMALAAGRPLLVRGEPGSGKTQLARAAAQELNRHFMAQIINGSSEGQDLLWTYDPVARLHDAQTLAAEAAVKAVQQDLSADEEAQEAEGQDQSQASSARSGRKKTARYRRKKSAKQQRGDREQLFKLLRSGTATGSNRNCPLERSCGGSLDPGSYVSPGILWWALDCVSARRQHEQCRCPGYQPAFGCCPAGDMAAAELLAAARRGFVLLLDEIDKAEASLPNALLEVLGNGSFQVPLLNHLVTVPPGREKPLVIITTNEERELPPAFVRRCLVLNLRFDDERHLRNWWNKQAYQNPNAYRADQFQPDRALIGWLAERGEVHFEGFFTAKVRERAAELLVRDRREAKQLGMVRPGQAEYLDLLRALREMTAPEDSSQQLALLERISPYALVKHPLE
ncbi:AAA domain (Dynein-related subfamily) [Candidatus Electronema halotolerans]